MAWLYYLLLFVVLLVGLFATVLGLPGLWLMVGGLAIFAMLTGFGVYVGWPAIITMVLLAAAAEVAEFLAGTRGAKQAGGSRRAGVGAVVGALLGGIFLTFIPIPVVGTIIGVCLGAFIGAAVMELTAKQDVAHSFRVGTGAAKGRFYGIIVKLCFGVAILFGAMWAAIPIGGRFPPPTSAAAPVAGPTTTPAITTAPSGG